MIYRNTVYGNIVAMVKMNSEINFHLYVVLITSTSISASNADGACFLEGDFNVCNEGNLQPQFRRLFSPPSKPVPTIQHDDPDLFSLISKQEPIIIKGHPILQSATKMNIPYLQQKLALSTQTFGTYITPERLIQDHNYDNNYAGYKVDNTYVWKQRMFAEFMEDYEEIKKVHNSSRIYIQHIMDDAFLDAVEATVDEAFLTSVTTVCRWGESLRNVILLGMEDYSRNMHIDYDEALLHQIIGHKRVLLFHPSNYGNVYPYPVHHARDRYSRVNFDNIDYDRYPKAANLEGHEAILSPGDVLYVPTMWWHYVEADMHSMTMSVGFRYLAPEAPYYMSFFYTFKMEKPSADGTVEYDDVITIDDYKTGSPVMQIQKPDSAHALVHIRRHIEHIIAEATGSYRKVPEILHEIIDGRFDGLEYN